MGSALFLKENVMKKIKVLLLDLDGTSLKKNKVDMSEANLKAIQEAIAKGVEVVPCTGRVLDMFPKVLQGIEGIRYAITCHGARVVDIRTGATLYEKLIPPEETVKILEVFEGRNVYAEIAAKGLIFLEKAIGESIDLQPVPSHHVWYVEEEYPILVEKPSEFFRKHKLGMEKVNIYGMAPEIQEEVYKGVEAVGATVYTFEGVSPDLEFLAKDMEKIDALDTLLLHLGYSREECMIVGDSRSDIDLIRKLGIGVAMGNAPEWIQKDADFVTARCEEDGVARAIEKFILS